MYMYIDKIVWFLFYFKLFSYLLITGTPSITSARVGGKMEIRNSSVKVRQPNRPRNIIAFTLDNRPKQRSCRDFTRRRILICSFKYRQTKRKYKSFIQKKKKELQKVCKPFWRVIESIALPVIRQAS